MPGMTDTTPGKMEMGDSKKMPAGMDDSGPAEVMAQKWDDQKQMLVRTSVRAPAAEVDVKYDALLANRRTLDNPEMIPVEPEQSVLLRMIAAASATNFYVDTGALEAEILAVDGKAVRSIKGNFFQLGTAQRLDLRAIIPKEGGAFPILAQGEGTKLLCGVVLITKGASTPLLSRTASASTVALDNTQEKRLLAANPLPDRKSDRTLPAALSGDMATYVWKINGEAYPNRDSLDVRNGERVGIVFTNATSMGHPMHLHGHDFQVAEVDGEKLSGALRDTILVPPGSKITVAFDAESRKAKREDCGGAYESGDEKIHAWYEAVFMLRRLYLRDKAAFLNGTEGMRPAHMRSERKPADDHSHGAKHRHDSNERGHLVCCEASLPSLCSSSVQLGKCCSLTFDRVDFNGLYFDAHFFEPGDGLLDFFSLAIEFNRDDADLLGNARLPEVRHDGKLFSELVDYRARDKTGRIHQPETGDLLGHAGSIDAEKRARRKKCVLTLLPKGLRLPCSGTASPELLSPEFSARVHGFGQPFTDVSFAPV